MATRKNHPAHVKARRTVALANLEDRIPRLSGAKLDKAVDERTVLRERLQRG